MNDLDIIHFPLLYTLTSNKSNEVKFCNTVINLTVLFIAVSVYYKIIRLLLIYDWITTLMLVIQASGKVITIISIILRNLIYP